MFKVAQRIITYFITMFLSTELLSILARPPNFSQYDPYSPAYIPTPADLVITDKDRENVPTKKNIPSFSQLSGSQPLPPPPPGNNHGSLGMKMSPTAKRGIPPGIAGKSLSMSSIPVDRDIGNGTINGNGDDHNGYSTGTANGWINSNHNGNYINLTQDDSNSLQEYGRVGSGSGSGSGGSNKGLHNGFSGTERITPDDSSSGHGNGGTRDLSRVLSPPQSVSMRPSFSRLSIAGPMHHTGEGYILLNSNLLSI